jgi:hypothetical protein
MNEEMTWDVGDTKCHAGRDGRRGDGCTFVFILSTVKVRGGVL